MDFCNDRLACAFEHNSGRPADDYSDESSSDSFIDLNESRSWYSTFFSGIDMSKSECMVRSDLHTAGAAMDPTRDRFDDPHGAIDDISMSLDDLFKAITTKEHEEATNCADYSLEYDSDMTIAYPANCDMESESDNEMEDTTHLDILYGQKIS